MISSNTAHNKSTGSGLVPILAIKLISLCVVFTSCGTEHSTTGVDQPNFITEIREVTIENAVDVSINRGSADVRGQITSVAALPHNINIREWGQLTLRAMALDSQGNSVPDVKYEWSIANPSAGHLISHTDANYRFKAAGQPGNYPEAIQVTAIQRTPDGAIVRSTYVDVTIVRATPQRTLSIVETITDELVAAPGQVLNLKAMGFDSFGRPVDRVRFEWRLTVEEIGTINQLGYLTVRAGPGTYKDAVLVTGYATDESTATTFISLTVVDEPPSHQQPEIFVFPKSASIAPEGQIRFTAGLVTPDGRPMRPKNASWSILDPSVGTIDNEGLFKPRSGAGGLSSVVTFEAVHDGPDGPILKIVNASIKIRQPYVPSPLDQLEIIPNPIISSKGTSAVIRAAALGLNEYPAENIMLDWHVSPQAGHLDDIGRFVPSGKPGVYRDALRVIARQQVGDHILVRQATSDVHIAGEISRVEIRPGAVLLETDNVIHFSAKAFDDHDIYVPNVAFEWSVVEPDAGTIDLFGNFFSGKSPGKYKGAVVVRAIQSIVEKSPYIRLD